jgi:hypothetical protein
MVKLVDKESMRGGKKSGLKRPRLNAWSFKPQWNPFK